MKITLFTANQKRHNYFINLLSKISDELYVIQENRTIFPGIVPNHYPASELMKKYFLKVKDSENRIFGNDGIKISNSNVCILPMLAKDINFCSIDFLSNFLKSDLYIIFGSSFIKGELVDFLIDNEAINIHTGISPYYRGTDCNFWAIHDKNPHLVGATIHMLSKGLDSGNILYHAIPKYNKNIFDYTMSSVIAAFYSITERIQNNQIKNIISKKQNKNYEIRYSKKNDFKDTSILEFNKNIEGINFNKYTDKLFKDPFFLS